VAIFFKIRLALFRNPPKKELSKEGSYQPFPSNASIRVRFFKDKRQAPRPAIFRAGLGAGEKEELVGMVSAGTAGANGAGLRQYLT